MSKPIEERLSIDLPDLKRRGFFGGQKSGSIYWRIGDQIVSSVAISISFDQVSSKCIGSLTLIYSYAEQPVKQVIQMERSLSNLGRGGGIWYFFCPVTGRRCRTLLFGQSGFASRHAEGGLLYQAQLYSQKERERHFSNHQLKRMERKLALTEWMCKPHSKTSYRGKPTRPMLRYCSLTSSKKKSIKDD